MANDNELEEKLIRVALNTINAYNQGDEELLDDVLTIVGGVYYDVKRRYNKYLYFMWLLFIIKAKLLSRVIIAKNTPLEFPLEKYKENMKTYLDVNNRLYKYINKCIDEEDYTNFDIVYLLNINLNYLLGLSTEYFGYIADLVTDICAGKTTPWPSELIRNNNVSVREIEDAMKTLEL